MALETNKAVVRALVREVWNEGDGAAIPRYFAANLREQIGGHHAELLRAFSDLRVEIEDLIAEADKVAARLVVSGTHSKASFAGAPPSGRRLSWVSHRFYRLRDGQVVETWAMQDRLGLIQQLGFPVPTASQVNWADGESEQRPSPPTGH